MNQAYVVAGSQQYNSQLLYFTSASLTVNDDKLFFISDQNGSPNIYCTDLQTGKEELLSDNKEGYLKSYVYFDGTSRRGLGKASISLDPYRGIVYYIQGDEIRCCEPGGSVRTLATVPEGQVTAFTHVSRDGRRLCIPTTDMRALEYEELKNGRPLYNIDRRVQEEGLNSYLRVYDTRTGEELLCETVRNAWITHVQFNPADSNIILYNHEWPSFDCGIRRMWLFDGKRHIPLRSEGEGRSRDDWTCHEVWSGCGGYIIYHGAYQDGPAYVGRVDLENLSIAEIPFPKAYTEYGHFTVSVNGELVSDGYYHDGIARKPAEFISVQQVDWENRKMSWIPVCRHQSSWKSQDAHPHPVFNHKGDRIFFTSDASGTLKVYCVNTE